MTETISILGYVPSTLPVLMDICFETFGITHYRIHKNIEVDGQPEMVLNKGAYIVDMIEPGTNTAPEKEPAFGLSGPWGKYCVFQYFLQKYHIREADYCNILHPRAYLASSIALGTGILIEPGSVISSQASIGFGVSIKRSVSIGHHAVIGDFSELNPGVVLSGKVHIGHGCIIGTGTSIREKITIGDNTYIGMGSVVTKDIPAGVVAYGNPCKVVRDNDKPRLP